MDKIIQWQSVQNIRDKILEDIEILLINRDEIDSDIIDQAIEMKKFLSNEKRLKESLDNEGLNHFLETASRVMRTAKEEWEMKQGDKEGEM